MSDLGLPRGFEDVTSLPMEYPG